MRYKKALTKEEKEVLVHKYTYEGMDNKKAWEKINKLNDRLINKIIKMKQKGKTDKQINAWFKEEFEKMYQSLG